jgi:hypothetical protein
VGVLGFRAAVPDGDDQLDNVRSIRVAECLGLTPLREGVLLGDPVVVFGLDRTASE